MRNAPTLITMAIALLGVGGCSGCADRAAVPTASPATRPAGLKGLPLQFTVRQRTTSDLPGSGGRASITVDDVTRGQAMVTIASNGATLLSQRSMNPGDRVRFDFAGEAVALSLKRLDDALMADDSATFELSLDRPGVAALSEPQKIDALIDAVANLKGATFIRNGTTHSAQEAAEHLRKKRRSAGDRVRTATDFIDGIASKSSLSGEPYQIRFEDGQVVNAGEFLHERLREIESGR